MKALLTRPDVSRSVDYEALDEYLTYEYVIAPRTMLQGVHKLPAASWLRYRGGEVTVRRYWDPATIPVKPWTDADLRAQVREAFELAGLGMLDRAA